MRKLVKPVCLLMLAIGLISSLPIQAFASAAHSYYKDCTEFPRIYQGTKDDGSDSEAFNKIQPYLPIGTKARNSKKLGFNFVLWHDKGLVVYGDYTSVYGNSFKSGTKYGGEPYYMKNGIKGEYRYHGYDALSNRFTNMDFKDDIHSNESLESRRWVFHPWKSPKVSDANKTGTVLEPSAFNDAAINKNDLNMQRWINDGVPSLRNALDNAVSDGQVYNPVTQKQLYNFLNILSMPTSRCKGSGRMWRLAENGAIYYQTFPVNSYKKEHTPVGGVIEVTNKEVLEFNDYGENNKAGWTDETVTVKLKVTAELKDTEYMGNAIKEATYYNRKDIKTDGNGWSLLIYSPCSGVVPKQVGKPVRSLNKVTCSFEMTFRRGQLTKDILKNLRGTATSNYIDNEKDSGPIAGSESVTINNIAPVPTPPVTPTPAPDPEEPTPTPEPPEIVKIDVNLPHPVFDIVKYAPTENTTIENGIIVSKELYINSELVDFESFFSGEYVFGIGNDGMKRIDIIYTSEKGKTYLYTGWVYVYDTKPAAQFELDGSFKQNRLMKLANTSPGGNTQIVLEHYPITSYQWSYRGIDNDGTSRKIHDISDMYKELMYKKPGVYEVELIASNGLGRVSEPYIVRFEIFEDYKPAVDIGMNATDIARGEEITAYEYGAVSTDNDTIAANSFELWYDSNNDGVYDQKLNTYDGKLGFPKFTPTKLGSYKFINVVTEAFGEPTMPEYITPADTVSKTEEIEFTVDNCIPMTDIYIEVPIVRPKVDTLFMLDKNLDSSKTEYIKSHRMDYSNYLRSENIIPAVNTWDMKTYLYSQSASTTINSGDSYPPPSTSYESNGYSGTLNRTSVSNSPYTRDLGGYETVTDTKTASHSESQSGSFCTSCNPSGVSPAYPISGGSYYYSDGEGYSGSLPLDDYNYSDYNSGYCSIHKSVGIVHFTRTWSWSGTVSRTRSVWVPNIVTYDDYTGYYSGTIYKSVRQPYTDTFFPNSYKYLIYVSDNTVSELEDLKNVRSKSDAKLILIGKEAIKPQIAHDYFVLNDGRPIDELVKEAFKILCENNPAIPKYLILAGSETFNMHAVTIDEENDPVTEQKFQYVQDCNYFDNSTGMNPSAVTSYSDSIGWTGTQLNTFSKAGKYEIYTRAKDRPSTDHAFAVFSYYSGTPHIVVYAHRKPIALAALDWDYNSTKNVYKTTWVDKSYDLDHNISRADRGIVDRKIMFRKNGGEWLYYIPSELTYGDYELKYYVKDIEGAWSDPWEYNFTLANAPAIQLKAELKSQDSKFGINSVTMGTTNLSGKSIPSTEYLEGFNIWTRFPYGVYIEEGFWNGSSDITTPGIVNYNTSTGTKAGNDINWNSIPYQIPPLKTDGSYLYDGTYTYRIRAVGDYSQTSAKDFTVRIYTPINLVPEMASTVTQGYGTDIKAATSKYVSSLKVTLYQGTSYQTTANMSGTTANSAKAWIVNHTVPAGVPAGIYTASFEATTVNGRTEVKTLSFKVDALNIVSVNIKGYWNHWRGQIDLFGKQMTNEPHRFLSYETVSIDVATVGNPDKITVEFSPELQAMKFTDKFGNVYDYKEEIGKYVYFPLQLNMTSANTAAIEYSMPLAPSTKDSDNNRIRPAYWMKVTAYKGSVTKTYSLDGTPGKEFIEITGNIYDHVYIQPVGSPGD